MNVLDLEYHEANKGHHNKMQWCPLQIEHVQKSGRLGKEKVIATP